MTQVVYKTKTTTIVDRTAMNKMPSDELGRLMVDLVTGGSKVTFVDSAATSFSLKALEKAIETNDAMLPALLEYHEIYLTPADLAAVVRAREIQATVREAVAARREALRPDYVFAPIPAGWAVDTHLTIGTRLIRRIIGPVQYYTIGVKACQRLWEHSSKYWAGEVKHLPDLRVRASGDAVWAVVSKESVQLGCQRIERHELEQVALAQGWTFPKGPLPA